MADVLSEKARALIARPVLASLATLNPDGSPQVTPLWVDLDGDDVVFNTARGRRKARNLERDGRVAVTVIDPDDQYNVVAFRGTVTDISTEGADAHIDALAKKYLGVDTYPMRREGEVRIRVTVRHGPHRHAGLSDPALNSSRSGPAGRPRPPWRAARWPDRAGWPAGGRVARRPPWRRGATGTRPASPSRTGSAPR